MVGQGEQRNKGKTGTYILLLRLEQEAILSIGGLGVQSFAAGWYLYVGSAFGPGGLPARLKHHLRHDKARHWHVDYLRKQAPVREAWFAPGDEREECAWSELLSRMPGINPVIKGFGSSDCACATHLFYARIQPKALDFLTLLRQQNPQAVLLRASGSA